MLDNFLTDEERTCGNSDTVFRKNAENTLEGGSAQRRDFKGNTKMENFI